VGWLQHCLVTGLVFISSDSVRSTRGCAIHPAHKISPSWRHRSTAQEQSYKRQSYGVNWRRCLEFGRTSGVTGTGTLQVDGRAEWHQEERVIQCDFSMGYSAATMHFSHRPSMSQARRPASDEWFGPHHGVYRDRPTCHQQAAGAGGFRARTFAKGFHTAGVQYSVVLAMPTSCVACAGSHTVDSALGTGRGGGQLRFQVPSMPCPSTHAHTHCHAHCHSLGY
jgi:hypothetical protein